MPRRVQGVCCLTLHRRRLGLLPSAALLLLPWALQMRPEPSPGRRPMWLSHCVNECPVPGAARVFAEHRNGVLRLTIFHGVSNSKKETVLFAPPAEAGSRHGRRSRPVPVSLERALSAPPFSPVRSGPALSCPPEPPLPGGLRGPCFPGPRPPFLGAHPPSAPHVLKGFDWMGYRGAEVCVLGCLEGVRLSH